VALPTRHAPFLSDLLGIVLALTRVSSILPAMRTPLAGLACVLALAVIPHAVRGQDDNGVRVGVTVGGTSFIGLSLEFFDGQRSMELAVGTWSARDLSISVVGRQYFGAKSVRPVVGLGLWTVVAWPGSTRPGFALVARAPIGFEWNPGGGNFLSMDINVNRGLWVRRTDPFDDTPMSHRLVPLPGLAYRWRP
jgi:hypothetical protein